MCALTADWELLAVANSLVALNLDLAADVSCDLTAEITFDLVVTFDELTELDEIRFLKVLHSDVGRDTGRLERLICSGRSDPEDIGECDLKALFARQVDTN
jgi:hypothetical protein